MAKSVDETAPPEPAHVRLRRVDPYEFEQFVAALWERQGWHTEVSKQTADRGIDIVATKTQPFAQKQVIQAKRYKAENKVGSQAVQQYSSLQQQERDADSVVIVTTSGFTRQAHELAQQLNVKLVDGPALSALINQVDGQGLVGQYVGTVVDQSQIEREPTATLESNDSDEEMGTGEAIIAVIQLLLILGVFGYIGFLLITQFLF